MWGSGALECNKFFHWNIWIILKPHHRRIGLFVPRNDLHVAVFWKLFWNSLQSFFEREGVRVVRIVWKHSFAWPSSHAGGTLLSNRHSVLVQIYPPLARSHCQPVRSVFMFVAWIQLSMTCNIARTFSQCYRHRLPIFFFLPPSVSFMPLFVLHLHAFSNGAWRILLKGDEITHLPIMTK